MGLQTPQSAILSAVIFNALIIVALVPLALHGVKFRPMSAAALLRRNLLIYGLGGIVAPFVGIKADRRRHHRARPGLEEPIMCMRRFFDGNADDGGDDGVAGAHLSAGRHGARAGVFPEKANGQLIERDGTHDRLAHHRAAVHVAGYFHSRPSAAGAGYDAGASSGSDLGPTNRALVERVAAGVARLQAENPGTRSRSTW